MAAKKSKKVTINDQQFASAVLAGNPQKPGEQNKTYIKRQLTLYLEALLLVDDFNELEETQFDVAKEDQRNQILEKIVERRYH
ncbi:hypothetical protein [Levilactobacillus bambusae]|uniref:Uncharacterized protein n=1 Tax=Levilactobacillus bambusae TaxID=2024736 RepID=A0A2V1MZ71_9LACO|nr:hypothetical protein [Levilactobacillus bambusae]PWG00112.1 hypothetical protein DCM90_04035 [Levilactobacillus bambusae]